MKKQLLVLGLAAFAAGAAMAQGNDTLAKIQSSGKVVLGTRDSSAPLAYTLGDGKYVGYHVELCERVLHEIAPKAKIEYTVVTSQNRIPLVQNGTVDIECGSTTNNEARAKEVSFAVTTYVTEVRTAVKANSGITSVAQLNGKTVATTTGTTSVQTLRKNERAKNIDFKVVYGKDHSDSFLMLESGRADAFVMDDNILAGLIANSKDPKAYKITGEVLSVEPIAIMFRKDDPKFKKAVDDALIAMMKSGEVTRIYNKWFMSPIPPKNVNVNLPMGATLKGLIEHPNDKPMEAYNK
jgi:glutamate/aspartate transport system substrate-binding protein